MKIYEIFNNFSKILELYNENKFKINSLKRALLFIKKTDIELSHLSYDKLINIRGIGASLASYIDEINKTGRLKVYEQYLEQTPPGIFELFHIRGLGPKKIKILYDNLNIDTIDKLLNACQNNDLLKIKGFTETIQKKLIDEIKFTKQNENKILLPLAELYEHEIFLILRKGLNPAPILSAGEFRRKLDIVSQLDFVIGLDDFNEFYIFIKKNLNFKILNSYKNFHYDTFECFEINKKLKINFYVTQKKLFYKILILKTGSDDHLKKIFNLDSQVEFNYDLINKLFFSDDTEFKDEKDFYNNLNLDFIPPDIREGTKEVDLAKANKLPILVKYEDIKGILHLHTTYSDGFNSIQDMALYAKNLGFEYIGVTDHSKTAVYAGGLKEEEIVNQHEEIKTLNQDLTPFKIFKGIESDILKDGSLDYSDSILKTFDFVIGSVHSNLDLGLEESTDRLIKAIENPYLTILGHPTGRLLLRRKGYPINYKKVIDACIANNVVIEINSNPNRLDLSWEWIEYAINKGCLLSINPDAHSKIEILNIKYGIYMARKGFASKENILSAFSLKDFEKFIKK